MVERRESCSLCGLRTALPVSRAVGAEEKRFCCEGCARVYDLASENGLLDEVLGAPRTGKWTRGGQAGAARTLANLVGPTETAYFSLGGMWCAGCATAAESLIRRRPGVSSVDISFASERGRVSFDPSQASAKTILAKLDGLGYRARVVSDRGQAKVERRLEGLLLQLIVAAAFGMQVMMVYLASLYAEYSHGNYSSAEARNLQYLALGLTVPTLFVGGISFLRGAWRAMKARTATMDTLVALGTVSAFCYSVYISVTGSGATYFDSAAMITTFVMIGRYLEALGGSRARRDLNALLTLQPDYAWTRADGTWLKVDAGTLAAGMEVLVKAGERVPADCTVLEGAGAVDESLLTGESFPVEKGSGDGLMAGTLLLEGSLVARTTSLVSDSRLARISRLIEETLATKPRSQRIADRASAYFAAGIVAVAALSLLARLLLGHPTSESLLAAIAVLVVACPCALGLATPLALTISLSRAAGAGVVVRNPAALELAYKVQRVVFDKTGTITRGHLTVERTVAMLPDMAGGDQDAGPPTADAEAGFLCLAAAVEQFSEHPVARAITRACSSPLLPAVGFQATRGRGCSARFPSLGDAEVKVGTLDYVGADPGRLLASSAVETGKGRTIVWVARGEDLLGFIALRDELSPTAKETLAQLAARGVRTTILSGDHVAAVGLAAGEVGAEDFAAGLGPEDKVERIRVWQAQGEVVAVVGDGVNDAPALAQADLAIALAEGADLTADAADVILTRGDLRLVPWFMTLSGRTRRDIRQNLAWAFAYNVVAIPIAVAGFITPLIAAGAMAASSLLVVGNSLRLGRPFRRRDLPIAAVRRTGKRSSPD